MNSPKHPFKTLAEIRPSWGYATHDGSSYLRRSVLQVCHKVQRVKSSKKVCDGPSYLWRSLLQFRREVQRVDPSTQISELKCFGTETLDRPLCLWRFVLPVVEGNEESSRRITQVWDDGVRHGPSWPWRSVALSVDPVNFYQKWLYCSKWLKRLLQ